jgi:hypothetical protein
MSNINLTDNYDGLSFHEHDLHAIFEHMCPKTITYFKNNETVSSPPNLDFLKVKAIEHENKLVRWLKEHITWLND